ncbi:MAG: hypothetical protein ACREBD_04320 [Blastocatellia bacterium]
MRIVDLSPSDEELIRQTAELLFVIAGVMPDANGFGKPDIYLAKRVRTVTVRER